MSSALTIVREQRDRILEDAIDQNRRVVLSHQTPDGWRTFKAEMTSGSPAVQSLSLSVDVPEDLHDATLPKLGQTLGVTFREGHKKCMFGAAVESINERGHRWLVGLRWPVELQQLQRRAYERAKPPENTVVAVRLLRTTGVDADALEARVVRHGQLEDVSAGGMRVLVSDPHDFELDATHRCIFSTRPGKPALVVDGLVRHREAVAHGRACIGFQFVGLEASAEGRRTLDRLARAVSQFCRARQRGRR